MATVRQRIAISKILDSRGRKPTGRAMRESGYSEGSAKNPKNLTESKTFKQVFRETFTPVYLRKQHKQLANLRTLHTANIEISPETSQEDIANRLKANEFSLMFFTRVSAKKASITFTAPDGFSKKSALDMAYKITGDYAAIKVQDEDPLAEMTDEELDDKIAEREMVLSRYQQFKKQRKAPKNAGK